MNGGNDKTVSEVFEESLKVIIGDLFKFLKNIKDWNSCSVLIEGCKFFEKNYNYCGLLFQKVKDMIKEIDDPNNIEACIDKNCSDEKCKIHKLSSKMNELMNSYSASKEYFNQVSNCGNVWLVNLIPRTNLLEMKLSYNKVFNNGELVNRGGKVYGKVYGCKYICQKLNELFEGLELLIDEMDVVNGINDYRKKIEEVKNGKQNYEDRFNKIGKFCYNFVAMYEGLPGNKNAKYNGDTILNIQAIALSKITDIYHDYINKKVISDKLNGKDVFCKDVFGFLFENNKKNVFEGVTTKIIELLEITSEFRKLEDRKYVEDYNGVCDFICGFFNKSNEINKSGTAIVALKNFNDSLDDENMLKDETYKNELLLLLINKYKELKKCEGVYNEIVEQITGGIDNTLASKKKFKKNINLIKKNIIVGEGEIKIESIEDTDAKNKEASKQNKLNVNNNLVNENKVVPNAFLGGKNVKKNSDDKKSVEVNYVEENTELVSLSDFLKNIKNILNTHKDDFIKYITEYKKLIDNSKCLNEITSNYLKAKTTIQNIYENLNTEINKINSECNGNMKEVLKGKLFDSLLEDFNLLKTILGNIKEFIKKKT